MNFFGSQRRRHTTVLFVSLFVSAVVTQLGVGWYQRRATARGNLNKASHEILRELTYSDRWDLTRFRQADISVDRYYVLDRTGLVIDVEKLVPDLVFQADLTALDPGLKSITVPTTNEAWRLLVMPVRGGRVVLGYSSPDDITRVDERLRENAKYFGDSLETAIAANVSDTDRYLEYAVLDDRGHVRFALGGIPLTLLEYPRFAINKIVEWRANDGMTYGVLSVPVSDGSGQTVGSVTVVDELPPQPWVSLRAWLMNLSASLFLAFAGTLLGVRYIREEFRPQELLRGALERGESSTVEFKPALRWDYWQTTGDRPNDPGKGTEQKSIAEASAVARVAGFLNSRPGGTLLIGVADDKTLLGLDRDYESLVKPREDRGGPDKDRDRFQLHLRSLLSARIGHDVSNLCVDTAIVNQGGKDVCVVHAGPSPKPVYVPDTKGKAFYLRVGASTVPLDVEQAVAYCRERWPMPLWARIRRGIRGA